MNIVHTAHLNLHQRSQALALAGLCCSHDHIRLCLPLEEDCQYFLLYDNQNLLSILSLYFPSDELCECSAFTLPENRRQGLFGFLLEAALTELTAHEERRGCDAELVFPVDERCADTMAALDALDAQFWYAEHMMARRITRRDARRSPRGDARRRSQRDDRRRSQGDDRRRSQGDSQRSSDSTCIPLSLLSLSGDLILKDWDSGGRCSFWVRGQEAGSCRLILEASGPSDLKPSAPEPSVPEPSVPESSVPESSVPEPSIPEPSIPEPSVPEPSAPGPSEASAYLYDFQVIPGLRRQGIGTACLYELFAAAWEAGIRNISLQVSGQNEAALALYRKTGFQITESLSYYIY